VGFRSGEVAEVPRVYPTRVDLGLAIDMIGSPAPPVPSGRDSVLMGRCAGIPTMPVSFSSKLIRPEVVGAWTFAMVPKTAAATAGFRPRMRVKGTIDGVPFRSSLIPRGGGEVFVVVNQEMRERIGKTDGQSVQFVLDIDTTPPVVDVHPALKGALDKDAKAKATFERFTVSQRLAYVRWIADAKQDATRERRVALAIEKIRRGEKFN
jgi:Bacteriocin-protection, YdeI or OmpD-Associated/Domain of unknown function (DUF1905)